jgi:hypothetical protein
MLNKLPPDAVPPVLGPAFAGTVGTKALVLLPLFKAPFAVRLI